MIRIVAAAAALCLFAASAVAQTPEPTALIEPGTIAGDIWEIVQPIVTLFVSLAGPALATWLAMRLAALLKINDENARKELEAKIRAALHASALNGLKFAMTNRATTSITPAVLNDAITYIRTKSPDTAAEAGVSDRDLEQIILSKAPDVLAAVKAAAPAGQ